MSAANRSLAEIADMFDRFARVEAQGVSSLYERLAQTIAKDEGMLDLASCSNPGQPVPNMLFGAVHFLLLSGIEHPLS